MERIFQLLELSHFFYQSPLLWDPVLKRIKADPSQRHYQMRLLNLLFDVCTFIALLGLNFLFAKVQFESSLVLLCQFFLPIGLLNIIFEVEAKRMQAERVQFVNSLLQFLESNQGMLTSVLSIKPSTLSHSINSLLMDCDAIIIIKQCLVKWLGILSRGFYRTNRVNTMERASKKTEPLLHRIHSFCSVESQCLALHGDCFALKKLQSHISERASKTRQPDSRIGLSSFNTVNSLFLGKGLLPGEQLRRKQEMRLSILIPLYAVCLLIFAITFQIVHREDMRIVFSVLNRVLLDFYFSDETVSIIVIIIQLSSACYMMINAVKWYTVAAQFGLATLNFLPILKQISVNSFQFTVFSLIKLLMDSFNVAYQDNILWLELILSLMSSYAYASCVHHKSGFLAMSLLVFCSLLTGCYIIFHFNAALAHDTSCRCIHVWRKQCAWTVYPTEQRRIQKYIRKSLNARLPSKINASHIHALSLNGVLLMLHIIANNAITIIVNARSM